MPADRSEDGRAVEYEYATVRSDDAAKWVGRDGWEVAEQHAVQLRRIKPPTCPYWGRVQPDGRISANQHPLCLNCAERLVRGPGTSYWRHKSDPRADVFGRQLQDGEQ